jgi:hypothetical protein
MTIFGYLTYCNLHMRIQPIGSPADSHAGDIAVRRRDRELLYMVLVEVCVYLVTMVSYPIILLEIATSNVRHFDSLNPRLWRAEVFSCMCQCGKN